MTGPRTIRSLLATFSLVGAGLMATGTAAQAAAPSPHCWAGQRVSTPRLADTEPVSAALVSSVRAQLAQARRELVPQVAQDARTAGPSKPPPYTVRVYVHAIRTWKARDPYVTRAQARRAVAILNAAYAGQQNAAAAKTPIRFVQWGYDLTRKGAWYQAVQGSRYERQMKRALHIGYGYALNLYFTNPHARGLLGWSTFPWRRAGAPRQDGVVINLNTLPGGSARGYNLGDTVVHETGHWLGLFHTFQGGCSEPNDGISDTPEEASPNFECPAHRDTCPAPGVDPIHNFMDYSYDSCMYEFTPDQAKALGAAYLKWRY